MKKAMQCQILFSVLVLLVAALPAWAFNVPNPVQQVVDSTKKTVDSFFSEVKNRTIAGAQNINQWGNDAAAAARKKSADFSSCPSPDAQNLYNDLKNKRDSLTATRDQANQAVRDADAALGNCLRVWPDGPNGFPPSACRASYTGLPFKGIANGAQASINALNTSMNGLKALKCISGCNRTAGVDYPSCSVGVSPIVNVSSNSAQSAKVAQSARMAAAPAGIPLPVNNFDVCVDWNPGAFTPIWNPGPAGVQAGVDIRFPKCNRTVNIPGDVCTSWDVNLLLPKLKEFKLVPPSIQSPNVTISTARQNVAYFSVEPAASCSQPAVLCSSVVNSVAIPAVLPLNLAWTLGPYCTQKSEIGCANPPFGLVPVSRTLTVPDPSSGTVSWKGPKVNSLGSVKVDLTRPEFSIACRQRGFGPNTGGVPNAKCATKHIDLPGICIEPRWGNLVGNP
ncbi:MAG TPA: hypothetical protein HPP94_05885 [Desulfuromonadales bacterium]|nr:hypothetical protein [Desulfuromonadales bacterium]